MARRKSQYLDDGSSSSGDDSTHAGDDDNYLDSNDPDVAAERELFRNPYGAGRGRKRTRQEAQEDATYGVWARTDDDHSNAGSAGRSTAARGRGAGSGRRGGGGSSRPPDYLRCARISLQWLESRANPLRPYRGQAFVAAGQSKRAQDAPIDNLSTALGIEAPREDEEDVAMELGGGSSDEEAERGDAERGDSEQVLAAEDIAGEQLEHGDDEQDQEEDEDLPPVPGLARPSASPSAGPEEVPEPEPSSSLAFAPRGLGARPGIGGGGAGRPQRGGLGSAGRGGIGASAARTGLGAFTAASTLSTAPDASRPESAMNPASGTASPLDGASTPHTGLGSSAASRPGLGGIGSRPNQALVDSLRAELAGPAPGSPSETVTDSFASSSSAGVSRTASPAAPPVNAVPSGSHAAAPGDSAPREKRSFLPAPPKPAGSAAPKAKLSKSESVHFARLASSGSVGMKMLEKMGWQSGSGLGREGQGIVTPVGEGQKIRVKNEGIRAGERSQGALLEERRR